MTRAYSGVTLVVIACGRSAGAGKAADVLNPFWLYPWRIGTVSTAATDSTPGTVRAAASTPSHAARVRGGSGSTVGDTAVRATSTLRTLTPASSPVRRRSVRPSA